MEPDATEVLRPASQGKHLTLRCGATNRGIFVQDDSGGNRTSVSYFEQHEPERMPRVSIIRTAYDTKAAAGAAAQLFAPDREPA